VQRRSFSLLPWLAVGLVWSVSGCRPEQPVQSEGSARFVGHFELGTPVHEVLVVGSAYERYAPGILYTP
jgi:hypothetical protein